MSNSNVCTCSIGTLTTDPTLGQICIQPNTPTGSCTDNTWSSYTQTTCQKAATCTSTSSNILPSTTISTTANYCGDQYANKGCKCLPQVTPGLTPATQESADVTLICAYQENGIQYACDPGCCPGSTCSSNVATTSNTTSTTTSSTPDNPVLLYGLIALFVVYMLLLIGGIAYKSRK